MNRLLALSVSAATMVAIAGCGDAPTRSGQPTDPVTLTAATPGGIGGDVMTLLADQTSQSAVRIAPPVTPEYYEPEDDDYEGNILQLVRSGEFDVSVVRADILATAGATSLAVLQTPWLVQSETQAAKVAADPLADDLMSDLAEIDLVGLALVPGGLRHPIGYGRPVRGPEDYVGQAMNTRHGDGMKAIAEALGAHVDHSAADVREERIASGELRLIETALISGAVDPPAVVTSNVTLITKFDVVFVRKAAWDTLTEPQREQLRESAVRAGTAAVDGRQVEAEALDAWCAGGALASIVATPEQVTGLHEKLAPVVAAATSDPRAKALAERIADLGKGTKPPSGQACGSTEVGANEDYLVERVGDQDVLDGVWRLNVDADAMVAAGVGRAEADSNAGTWTLSVDGHIAAVDQPRGTDCRWDFYFNGNEVSIDFMAGGNDECWGLAHGTYERTGDLVTLQFDRERFYDVLIDNAMFADGLHKVG